MADRKYTVKQGDCVSSIAYENDLTIYDSLYLAVAKSSEAVLFTEDKKILSCSKKYTFVEHIRDYRKVFTF